MTKNTAVIGVGWFGKAHARVYNELSNLTAVCDLNQETTSQIAKQYGVNAYSDANEMLKHESIDSLSIVTPPSALPTLALKCAKAGVNILIEKPLGNTVEDLKPLIAFNESIRIMPGHLELFNPVTEDLHGNIEKIGSPIYVSSRRIGLYPRRQWGIGVMHDLGYHEIYMQRSLFGYPSRVESLMRCYKNHHEDSALVIMKFKNGV
ncbi:Gfo/Idh/MocA family oxidoreductase, partial [Candidatus Bathyarchaeota archaeon]|nr:Gfo/Idh/MocA family oxidoreductase [Candidatus Bathyarchaeota archaeon]